MGGACFCHQAESRTRLRFVGGTPLGGRNLDLGEKFNWPLSPELPGSCAGLWRLLELERLLEGIGGPPGERSVGRPGAGAGLAGLALLLPAVRVCRALSGRWDLGRGQVVVVSVVMVSTWLSGVFPVPPTRVLPLQEPACEGTFHAYGTSGPHLVHSSN